MNYYERLAKVESGSDPNAKSKTSSATGKYQLTKGTFEELQKQVPWLQYSTWEEHQNDPKLQERAAQALTKVNERIMQSRGHAVDDLNRYLYHFAGPGGAAKLLSARGDEPVAKVLGQNVVKANQFLKNMSVDDLKSHFGKKMGIAPQPAPEQTGTPIMPWNLFAGGGEVKPWELYQEGKGSKAPSKWDTAVRVAGGVGQGAIVDPALAVMQLLGGDKGKDLARRQNEAYERFRAERGGTGFDASRLGGNVAGTFIPGLGAAGKLAKGAGLVKQGAITGATAGALSPVLPTPGETPDPDDPNEGFWGEKAKQVGGGAVLGGALNKLIAPGQKALKYKNPSQLPATPAQLAAQKAAPTDKVEQYRQMFPEANLTWGQALGDRANRLEQRAESWPFIGDIIKEARQKSLESQNVSMMNRALQDAGLSLDKGAKAGRNMFEEGYQKLSSKYDSLLEKAELPRPDVLRGKIIGTGKVDANGVVDLGAVGNRYQTLSEAGKKQFDNILEKQLFERFPQDPNGIHSLSMSGKQFKVHEENIKESVNALMQGTGEERIIGGMLRDALGEAYSSLQGKSADVAKQLKGLNKSYAQYKTLEKASTASGASSGLFNPLQTIRAATTGARSQVARGKGLLQPEAELSQDVLGRVYPDSGTAGRLMTGNPAANLLYGALSLPAELLYNPKLTSLVTQGGTRLGRAVEGTRLGGAAARQSGKITGGATRYQTSGVGGEEEDEEEGYAMGGSVLDEPRPSPLQMVNDSLQNRLLEQATAQANQPPGAQPPAGAQNMPNAGPQMADGGEVWSDIKGKERALQDPREIAYGQPLEDTTFIGAASKLFRPKLVQKAEKMEKAGKTPQEIWNKTMTGRLPKSGEWAQEISDDAVQMHGVWDKTYRPLDKGIKAPELFESYPDVRNMVYRNNPDLPVTAQHSYAPMPLDRSKELHHFDLNLPSMQKRGQDPKSPLLHEIQHYIQAKEGWPQGGTSQLGAELAGKAGLAKPMISPEDVKKLTDSATVLKQLQSRVAEMPRFKGQAAQMRKLSDEINKVEDILEKGKNKMTVDRDIAMDFYRRLGGEVQSRLTQKRMGLTGAERKQFYPFEARSEANPWGMDVDPNNLIMYREADAGFADGGTVSRETVPEKPLGQVYHEIRQSFRRGGLAQMR